MPAKSARRRAHRQHSGGMIGCAIVLGLTTVAASAAILLGPLHRRVVVGFDWRVAGCSPLRGSAVSGCSMADLRPRMARPTGPVSGSRLGRAAYSPSACLVRTDEDDHVGAARLPGSRSQ